MEYFEKEENVRAYIKMCEDYDGQEHIELLRKFLPEESTVLELGMGPGVDLDILKQYYQATGSDYSAVFLKLYREKHPDAKLLQLDAISIDTHQTFDAIYSNKVLHHLSHSDLRTSVQNQYVRLNEAGILLHTFWFGDKTETHKGMRFNYYTEDQLTAVFEPQFKIQHINRYTELDELDSVVLVAKRK